MVFTVSPSPAPIFELWISVAEVQRSWLLYEGEGRLPESMASKIFIWQLCVVLFRIPLLQYHEFQKFTTLSFVFPLLPFVLTLCEERLYNVSSMLGADISSNACCVPATMPSVLSFNP